MKIIYIFLWDPLRIKNYQVAKRENYYNIYKKHILIWFDDIIYHIYIIDFEDFIVCKSDNFLGIWMDLFDLLLLPFGFLWFFIICLFSWYHRSDFFFC